MTFIIAFYVAFLCMVIMIALKSREVRTGRASLVSRMGRGTDHIFSAISSSLRRGISFINKHTFIALMHWIAYHILVRIRGIYVEIKHRALTNPHGRRIIDMVRGRGEVRNHGASFYLRKIGVEEK